MMNSIVCWLEKTANLMSDKEAVCDCNGMITYGEYRNMGVAIAYNIISIQRRKLLSNKKPIVIYMPKGKEMLISFVGVAYSGNFYSPIDIEMPLKRVDKILDTLKPSIVVTTSELRDRFEQFDYQGDYIIYDDIEYYSSMDECVLSVSEKIVDTDLLYVLFTSGSTGVPKGVSINHRAVIDYIEWVVNTFKINSIDRFGNQAPFYFDNSILDIYSCMMTGATLYIIPKDLFHQVVPLLKYLKTNSINTIFWVPSALVVISKLKALKNVDLSNTLSRVLFCGEVMPNKQLNIWRKFLPNVLYANLYGPTEITDACTCYIVDREFSDHEVLPIGKAMNNTDVFVLDDNDHLVIGEEVGELCVRGTCLSSGYYNNPEKTKEVFVQNPLNTAVSDVIYRTGDLVKYNEYGELIFLARKDYQIKHRGHRIELGEIETVVSSLDEITLCCCLYNQDRQEITLFLDVEIDSNTLIERIGTMIPEYMIPGRVITLKSFPMNLNGKIDREKLKELMK